MFPRLTSILVSDLMPSRGLNSPCLSEYNCFDLKYFTYRAGTVTTDIHLCQWSNSVHHSQNHRHTCMFLGSRYNCLVTEDDSRINWFLMYSF